MFRHSPFGQGGCGGRRFAHGFGRHGGGGCGGGGGGGRRGGRFFDAGDLRLLVLHLLADKPSHGYELIKDIEERMGGAYSPSPGVIYPTLSMLEDMGLAEVAEASGGRKLYRATEAGTAHLAEQKPALDAILTRIGVLTSQEGGPRNAMPQVMRAMHNLRTALRMRLSRGQITEADLRGIIEALDGTARKIEQS